MTAAEVVFRSGHRCFTIITYAANAVVGWIEGVVLYYAPCAGANARQVVGLHIECSPSNGAIALLQLCYGFTVRVAVDLGDAASRRLLRDALRCARLDHLPCEVMGIVINRADEVLRSEWRERVLLPEQVVVACANAFVSYELGRILSG
ncbi:hypothetical protein ACMD2_24886 [Ananas comosus]|uniref:Uncharacterized protein n=1 Tax=Ananas comosus TaxID=4615 RepID=A0A199V7E2_ANACO|nr:hypothetical protein ACMD2_24886 [Ananas comosus]